MRYNFLLGQNSSIKLWNPEVPNNKAVKLMRGLLRDLETIGNLRRM
jgi:hypothetical protein